MKIAILTTGNLNDMKGIMNYVHEKAKTYHSLHIDYKLFFIETYYDGLLRALKNKGRVLYKKENPLEKDGITYTVLYRKVTLKSLLWGLFNKQFIASSEFKHICTSLNQFDAITSHQLPCHYIAMKMKEKYNIPFLATWHGSDVNASPRKSKRLMYYTREVMEKADMNFFVSKGLLKASDFITTRARKDYIYTGPASSFYKYDEKTRSELREQYGVSNQRVISYSGNLIPMKNVMVLPSIFRRICEKMPDTPFAFWIIGDGVQQQQLISSLDETGVCYRMFGKVQPGIMPDLMNCTDILVMPSLMEAFSLSVVEARCCGSCVVASNVGGLPESAGEENCFPLDGSFVERITDRIKEMIANNEQPKPLSEEHTWVGAVNKELSVLKEIVQ